MGEVMLNEFFNNALPMVPCHAYILLVIYVSERIEQVLSDSREASRKLLHVMIRNLPSIMTFFHFEQLSNFGCCPQIDVTLPLVLCSVASRGRNRSRNWNYKAHVTTLLVEEWNVL